MTTLFSLSAGSIFKTRFDVVVHGGGTIGFAAARTAAARGLDVLVIEPTGQLLWESTRALENHAQGPAAGLCREWDEWLARLADHGAARDGYFDTAFAEVLAARDWADGRAGVRVLFYARPVGAETDDDGRVASLTLATKAGFRVVRALRWIDASEGGELAALCERPTLPRRFPVAALCHSLVLQGSVAAWARHEGAVTRFAASRGARLAGSVREGERRLSWDAPAPRPWHLEMTDLLGALRAAVSFGEDLAISQLSAEPLPHYDTSAANLDAGVLMERAANLLVLSPALTRDDTGSIGVRFQRGADATRAWLPGHADRQSRTSTTPWRETNDHDDDDAGAPLIAPSVVRTTTFDVVVAGTGTAGALAALAAARHGAHVAAVDFATFPGGVGTGGGITGYFFGLEGGLQEEIDRATTAMNLLLEGASPTTHRWHHEGKKLALLGGFERDGVEFHGGALLCGVERDDDDGRVHALLVATEAGLERMRARAFIDSTGDGDLCAQAGAGFENGRAGDGRSLAYSQPAFVWKSDAEPGGGGRVATRNYDAGWTDPSDPEDLSRARLLGVAQHWRERWSAEFPLAIAPLPGLRQSRHIHADRTLTFRDLAGGERFADAIGEAGSIADTHSVDYEFEDDEAVFFFWVCRLFRRPLRCELPYRMLLPRGLCNVWIACRAAGIAPTAFYAVRMQRDMQRLGEAAGIAAALAARNRSGSRAINVSELQGRLGLGTRSDAAASPPADATDDVARLTAGLPGAHLWRLYCTPQAGRDAALDVLCSDGRDATFYAAALLAMWADATAEPRLAAAIAEREDGPPPSSENTGAHGQEIDIPFWLIAVILLRRCGTAECVPVLEKLASRADNLLNVRTAIALTLERLSADGRVSRRRALEVAKLLLVHPIPDHLLAPSHSIWRRLRGESQLVLRNDCGADTLQDHSWQLHLVVARMSLAAGAPPDERALGFLRDERATVRLAFARLFVVAEVEAAGAA